MLLQEQKKTDFKTYRGYYGARKNVWTVAKNTWEKEFDLCSVTVVTRNVTSAHWLDSAYQCCRTSGRNVLFSRLMGALRTAGIEINRKVLVNPGYMNHPEAFKAIVAKVK